MRPICAMEYPGAHFTHPLRLAMLATFILAFFIISPTLILYSAGYRYDFKNGLLRETGSLSVDILPAETAVTLDGLLLGESMPLRINNLTPHKYTIKFTSPGYYSLEQEIEINKNQTTYYKEISLLKKSKSEAVNKGEFTNPNTSPSGKYLIYFEKNGHDTVTHVLATATGRESGVYRINGQSALRASWANKNDYVAITSDRPPYTAFVILDAAHPQAAINLLPKISGTVQKFVWQKTSDPELYFDTSSTIYSFFPLSQLIRPIAQKNFVDWYADDGNIWSLTYSTSTKEFSVLGDTFGFSSTLATFVPDDKLSNDWSLVTVQGKSALLHNRQSNDYEIIRDSVAYHVEATAFYLSPYNSWWIFSSPWEIWTYSDGGEPNLLTRTDEALTDVKPLDEYNTLALMTNKNIAALYPYYFLKQTILEKELTGIAINPTARTLYYTTGDGLWKLAY